MFYIEVPVGAYDLHGFVAGKLPERPPVEPHTLFFSSYALNRLLVAAGFEMVESVICPWTRAHVPVGDHRATLKGAKRREKARPLVVIARRPVPEGIFGDRLAASVKMIVNRLRHRL